MSVGIIFKSMTFRPLTMKEWLKQYASDMRVQAAPELLRRKVRPQIHLLREDDVALIPIYRNGSWRVGLPRVIKPGKNNVVVRLPAVEYGGKFLILDGTHRVRYMKPSVIFLDTLHLRREYRTYFTDLLNPEWD